MKLSDDFEINSYKDFLANKTAIFKLIEGVMDEIVKETYEKNPTFLISDYDKIAHIEDIPIGEKNTFYTTPIDNNKLVKVIF